MLFYGFKNYEEFKELFAINVYDGVKSRRNKILLALYKNRNVFRSSVRENDFENLVALTSMQSLRKAIYDELMNRADCHTYYINLAYGETYGSDHYSTDDKEGLCIDGSTEHIRYLGDRERVFKMRAGKMMRSILDDQERLFCLPEQVKVWFCEEFAARWRAYATDKQPGVEEYTLVVDDNFRRIYSSEYYLSDNKDFGSCMTDNDQDRFYNDAVKASAASLRNSCGEIVARCVIFNEVHDENGKIWRLAERQYASGCDDDLKRLLVNKLIEEGYIDGYKEVGADCHASTAFVANDGSSLSHKDFWIRCNLSDGDTLSYQDTFKYYDINKNIARNRSFDWCVELDTTDSEFYASDRVYSEYLGVYMPEEDASRADHRDDWFPSEDVLYCINTGTYEYKDDIIEINGNNYYAGHDARTPDEYGVYECPNCEEYFSDSDGYCSEITGHTYCCESCREEAEEEYKKENWCYSEFDEDYFEDGVVTAFKWNGGEYEETTIHEDSLDKMISSGNACEWNGDYYIDRCVPEHMHEVA